MSIKKARNFHGQVSKPEIKLNQYARLAQLEALRSGDRKSCHDVLHQANQPEPLEIDFEAIKSFSDVRRLEYQIFNLVLRDDLSVQKASFCLEQLKAIGEEISNRERQKEHHRKDIKDMAEERKLFPAKLEYYKSLDEPKRNLFVAQDRNFSILLRDHQNQELRNLSRELTSQDDELDAMPSPQASSRPDGSTRPKAASAKAQSKISQSKNKEVFASSLNAVEPNNALPEAPQETSSESSLPRSAPVKADDSELRLPRVTNESFKYVPSPLSPPRKTYR